MQGRKYCYLGCKQNYKGINWNTTRNRSTVSACSDEGLNQRISAKFCPDSCAWASERSWNTPGRAV